jgi:hypothetical protein
MKEEGINVPALPCNFIRCANRKEAKKMILALTSQYGNMTEDGLYEFLEESGIGFEEMRDCFNFPEINMEDFGTGYYGDEIEVIENNVEGVTRDVFPNNPDYMPVRIIRYVYLINPEDENINIDLIKKFFNDKVHKLTEIQLSEIKNKINEVINEISSNY